VLSWLKFALGLLERVIGRIKKLIFGLIGAETFNALQNNYLLTHTVVWGPNCSVVL
jgi:hypothetical protein